MSTLYASFADPNIAERAAGALLDHGAVASDISLISNSRQVGNHITGKEVETVQAEADAKQGISSTTPGDVAIGAVKGAAIGTGVGIAAILASIFIPGLGLVWGSGALATAIAGAAGTALAGAAAGGVTGYLVDQGVPDEMVTKYSDTFYEGGAILALAVPSGDLPIGEAEGILTKYGAVNIATYNAPRIYTETGAEVSRPPMVVQSTNPDVQPVMIGDAVAQAPITVVDPVSGTVTSKTVIPPTVVTKDAVTGSAVVQQPVAEVAEVEAPAPATVHVVTDQQTGHRVVTETKDAVTMERPATTIVTEQPVQTVDPLTGQVKDAVVVDQQQAVVASPTVVDASGKILEPPAAAKEPVIVEKKTVLEEE